MNNLFSIKNPKKLSRGDTHSQLFVTGNAFVCDVTMNPKIKILQDFKQFTKGIGGPEAFVLNHTRV